MLYPSNPMASYEKLEDRLSEMSEIQDVVRTIYQDVRYNYSYEFEKQERYKEMMESGDSSQYEIASKQLETSNFRVKIYQKVFDFCDSLLQGKA